MKVIRILTNPKKQNGNTRKIAESTGKQTGDSKQVIATRGEERTFRASTHNGNTK